MTIRNIEKYSLITIVLVAALVPLITQNNYVLHIGIIIMVYAMLATSLNLIFGYVGELSLGHSAFFGLGAYVAAILSVSFGASIVITLAAAAAIGLVSGWVIGKITLRLRGPFFVIITLAFAEVLRIVAENWVQVTNGTMGVTDVHPALGGGRGTYYYLGLILLAVSLYASYRFVYSNMGRAAMTIRENRYIAQAVGINVANYALFAFVLGAMIAGVAGGMYAHYVSVVDPSVFAISTFTLSMIIMVIVGGKGTLVGPIIGAILVTILEESLRSFQSLRLSLVGLIVIALVIFMRQGIAGAIFTRVRRQS